MFHSASNMNQDIYFKIQEFFKSKPVTKAWIFGSYAPNENIPDADIDIPVEYEKGYQPGLFGILQIIEDLTEILSKRVDQIKNGFIYPILAKEVDYQKIQIYERNNQ